MAVEMGGGVHLDRTSEAPPIRRAVETHALRKDFAGFRAVNGVDLRLGEGKVHALVGPNGAGKTSLFNLMNGFLVPTSGRILLFGFGVTEVPPHHITNLGV